MRIVDGARQFLWEFSFSGLTVSFVDAFFMSSCFSYSGLNNLTGPKYSHFLLTVYSADDATVPL